MVTFQTQIACAVLAILVLGISGCDRPETSTLAESAVSAEKATSTEATRHVSRDIEAGPPNGVVTFSSSMLQGDSQTAQIDLGTALPNENISRRILLENSLPYQVRIIAISTTCGCLVAKPQDLVIGANSATTIDIQVKTGGSEQVIAKNISLALAAEGPEMCEFEVEVEVKTRVQNLLSFGRDQLLLDAGKRQSNPEGMSWIFPGVFFPESEIDGIRTSTTFPGSVDVFRNADKRECTLKVVAPPNLEFKRGDIYHLQVFGNVNGTEKEIGSCSLLYHDPNAMTVFPQTVSGEVSENGDSVFEFKVVLPKTLEVQGWTFSENSLPINTDKFEVMPVRNNVYRIRMSFPADQKPLGNTIEVSCSAKTPNGNAIVVRSEVEFLFANVKGNL